MVWDLPLNSFDDWPFNQCHIGPGAFVEHVLGAQYYIQFWGECKATKRLLSLDREIRYAKDNKIT